jgi:restriction system protein
MKFRMAPNSLFAILLRSPWWISLAIALVLATLAFALLPVELRPVGAASALPFLILGAMALKRQWNAPSQREIEAVRARIAVMGWPEFSALLAKGFERQGFEVEVMQGGADFLLRRAGRQTLVSAKRWKAARHGEDAVQALVNAMRARDAGSGAYIALGELSPQAFKLANGESIQVFQAEALARLLRA